MPSSLLRSCAAGIIVFLIGMVPPSTAQKGRTLFGENQVETIKAMKKIVKAIGVEQCTYCHIKKGGKPKFDLETPNKEIARHMKQGFVDSLVSRGRVELSLSQSGYKTGVVAVYIPSGENAGIHLTATTGAALEEGENLPEDVVAKSYTGVVALPEEREGISCMTCHNRKLHFLTSSELPPPPFR